MLPSACARRVVIAAPTGRRTGSRTRRLESVPPYATCCTPEYSGTTAPNRHHAAERTFARAPFALSARGTIAPPAHGRRNRRDCSPLPGRPHPRPRPAATSEPVRRCSLCSQSPRSARAPNAAAPSPGHVSIFTGLDRDRRLWSREAGTAYTDPRLIRRHEPTPSATCTPGRACMVVEAETPAWYRLTVAGSAGAVFPRLASTSPLLPSGQPAPNRARSSAPALVPFSPRRGRGTRTTASI